MDCLYFKTLSFCTNLKVLIPLLGPFITIFLGILTLPFIERFKKSLERKRLLEALLAELDDEIIIIDNAFTLLIDLYKTLYKIKKSGNFLHFFDVYQGEFKIFSIDRLLEEHFENLDFDIRHTIKHIKENIYFLNYLESKLTQIYNIESDEPLKIYKNIGKLEIHVGNYISVLLQHRYSIRYLIDILTSKKSKLKKYSEVKPKEAIEHQLNEMKKPEIIPLLKEYLFEKL